jgi:hypothetical protein
MAKTASGKVDLMEENADLRAQLTEAKEEVDGLVDVIERNRNSVGKLADLKAQLASRWVSDDCCHDCGCPMTYAGESATGVEQYKCQVCEAEAQLADLQRENKRLREAARWSLGDHTHGVGLFELGGQYGSEDERSCRNRVMARIAQKRDVIHDRLRTALATQPKHKENTNGAT